MKGQMRKNVKLKEKRTIALSLKVFKEIPVPKTNDKKDLT